MLCEDDYSSLTQISSLFYIDGAIPPVDDDHDGDVAEHHHRQGQDPGQARHKHRVEELLTKLDHY